MQGHKEQPYLSMLLLSRLSKIPENKKNTRFNDEKF